MKTRKFTRYLAAALALVMLLPLISVPAFAAESNVLWSEDFEDATSVGDVFSKWGVSGALTLTNSATDENNRVVEMPYKPMAPAEYYYTSNKWKSVHPVITVTSIDGDTLTGTFTADGKEYTVTGTINRENFATTATATDGTGATLSEYIVTGEVLDARQGIGNVAVTKTFKHSAWNYDDVDDYVLSMDIYIPGGSQGVFAVQVEGKVISSGTTFAAQPFFITASKTAAYLEKSGNCSYSANGAVSFPMGQWNTVTAIIDKDTGEYTVYLNNQYAYTAKGSGTGYYNLFPNEPISLNANSLIFQVNRGYNVSYYAGSVQLDNVQMAKNTDGMGLLLKAYNFDSADQDELSEVGAPYTGTVWNSSAKVTPSTTDPSNMVLYTDATPTSPYQYYLWYDKNKAIEIKDYEIVNGKLKSNTDVTLNGVTYTINESTINTGSFGTVADVTATSGTAQKVYVISGALKDAYNGGTNIAIPLKVKTSAWSASAMDQFVLSFDVYFSAGSKGTYQTILNGTEPLQVVLDGSKGTVKTGYTAVNSVTTTITLAEWHNITMVLDTKTSLLTAFVDGIFAFSTYCGKTADTAYSDFTANTFGMQYRRLAYPSGLAGYVELDNIVFNTTTKGIDLKYYSENFGSYASSVGQSATMGTNVNVAATVESDPLNPNNTAIKIPFAPAKNDSEILMRMNGNIPVENGFYAVTRNATTNAVEVSGYTVTDNGNGTYNITDGTNSYTNLILAKKSDYCAYWGGDSAMDQNWKMNHPQVSYTTEQKVILALDYFLSEDAHGNFIGQLHNYQTGTTSANWLALYTVEASTGKIGVGGTASVAALRKGEWNHVEVALNLISGDAVISVNGAEVASGNVGATNITIPAAKWSFAKLPRKQNGYQSFAGYVMVDNIEMLTASANNKVVTVDPENLLYVEIGGKKIYNNTFYITEGTQYNAVYLDVAKYASMLQTEEKNSIRLAEESGLRFATKVDMALFEELYALLNAGDVEAIEFGHLIAPADYLSDELSKKALDTAGKKYLEVLATYDKYYDFDNDDATTHFVGSIVDLYQGNIARDFAGRGFVTLQLKTGVQVDIYSSITQVADVKDVATRLLEKPEDYTEAQLAILNTFKAGNSPAVSESGLAKRAMQGLNVLAIGDSIFNGHSLAESDTWLALMAQTYDWNLTNLGQDGWVVTKNDAAWGTNNPRASMYDRLMNDAQYKFGGTSASYTYGNPAGVANTEVDLVLLEGGYNDYNWKMPLGDITSAEDMGKGDNYLGALNQMIIKLKELYPNAKIVLYTAWHGLPTSAYTVDGMKLLKDTLYANDASVYLVDAGNPQLNGGVDMADAAFRAEYACAANDTAHLNEKGMKIMLENMPLLLYRTLFA